MTVYCQPLPASIVQEILANVVRATCDLPGQTPARRETAARAVVHATLGFQPRDTIEVMLSSLAVVHFNLILDSAHDAVAGQIDLMKARTKSTIVALNRSLLGMLKELRLAQERDVVPGACQGALQARRRDCGR